MSKPINYPNRIQDKHANDKLREVIDNHNALKVAHDQTAQATDANTQAIAKLPSSYLTPGDVNSQISIQLGTSGSIYQKIVDILKSVNITVPTPSPASMEAHWDGHRIDGKV